MEKIPEQAQLNLELDLQIEKASNELQQQQLLYIQNEMLVADEDKDEDYHDWMKNQITLINKLIETYDSLIKKNLLPCGKSHNPLSL